MSDSRWNETIRKHVRRLKAGEDEATVLSDLCSELPKHETLKGFRSEPTAKVVRVQGATKARWETHHDFVTEYPPAITIFLP